MSLYRKVTRSFCCFRRRTRVVALIAAALVAGRPIAAQEVGNTEQEVIAALGTPTAMRDTGVRKVCFFRNGARVVFEKGIVVEVSGGSAPTQPIRSAPAPVVRQPTGSTPPRTPVERPARPVERSRAPGQSDSGTTLPDAIATPGLIGLTLVIGGFVTIIICQIVMLVQAFRTSILWGLAVFFLPVASLVFVMCYWNDIRKPFLIQFLVGVPAIFIGTML